MRWDEWCERSLTLYDEDAAAAAADGDDDVLVSLSFPDIILDR